MARQTPKTMLTAELSEIRPNTDASFQCVRWAERSPPLSVTLNGRPKRFDRSAEGSVNGNRKSPSRHGLLSNKKGPGVRDLEIQAM